MNPLYQHGHLRLTKRKNGSLSWEFMWRDNDRPGKGFFFAACYPSELELRRKLLHCSLPGTSRNLSSRLNWNRRRPEE
jgi:hypothetical protein